MRRAVFTPAIHSTGIPEQINGQTFENYIDWIAPAFLVILVTLPAASAPAGLSSDGLPVGVQIVAPRFEGAADP